MLSVAGLTGGVGIVTVGGSLVAAELSVPGLGVLTLEEILGYTAVFLAGVAGSLWLLALLERARPRQGQPSRVEEPGPAGPGRAERPGAAQAQAQAQQAQTIPGLDVAVARFIAMDVLEKLRSGEVKVALRSVKCPGEVVLDLNDMTLKCLDDEGTIRKLGEPKARDEVEEWLPK